MSAKLEQLSFFDLIEPQKQEEEPKQDDAWLDEWALVYLVTQGAGNRGNLFILQKSDAQKLCEDECSHGNGRGGGWIFMWTTLRHFIHQNDTYDGRLEEFVFIVDTGKQDADFERLGIKKPTLQEQRELLRSMGYDLVYEHQSRGAEWRK